MKEIAADKIRSFFEDLVRDKKTLVKVLSIVLILMLAAVLRIHGAKTAAVTVKAAEKAETETAEETDPDEAEAEGTGRIIFVDISGGVSNPGVYQVAEGTRLFEVVSMAGGLAENADINSVNQASFVEDGEKIIIPLAGEAADAAPQAQTSASADLSSLMLININTAAKEELTTLNGIGDVMAERIIEYRSSKKFKNKEDIKEVKGIGDGIYEKIKDSITC